jgi:uncharacterized MAPEG superfamily protein
MSLNYSYTETLAWSAAVLTTKNMVNHLLTVRCRLATNIMNQEVTPESEPGKWSLPLFPMFYHGMAANIGPLRSKNDLDRLQNMSINASQNETFFLALGFAWALLGDTPTWASKALVTYTYSRIAHFLLYVLVRKQPFRAIAWALGAGINLVMAGTIIQQLRK